MPANALRPLLRRYFASPEADEQEPRASDYRALPSVLAAALIGVVAVTPAVAGVIRGTNGTDVLRDGRARPHRRRCGADSSLSGERSGRLRGGRGGDRIARSGEDEIAAGAGDDRVSGVSGKDVLEGGRATTASGEGPAATGSPAAAAPT